MRRKVNRKPKKRKSHADIFKTFAGGEYHFTAGTFKEYATDGTLLVTPDTLFYVKKKGKWEQVHNITGTSFNNIIVEELITNEQFKDLARGRHCVIYQPAPARPDDGS